MFTYRFLGRFTFLAALAVSTSLTACASPDDDDVDDEEGEGAAASSEEMLTGPGIVIAQSIRGIRLDMTTRQVRDLLGKPDRVSKFSDGVVSSYTYGKTLVFFEWSGQRVKYVYTSSPGLRTKEGVGVGSLKGPTDALAGSRCFADPYLESDATNFTYSHLCEIQSGLVLTDFWFADTSDEAFPSNAKVQSVSLRRVR